MQRSGLSTCTFPLFVDRLPIPLQSSPHWFPILRRRFHDHFLDFLLEQPCGERTELFRVAAKHPAFKLELAFDFNVGDNYGQHLFMDINSRYSVGHCSSWPGAESVLRLP